MVQARYSHIIARFKEPCSHNDPDLQTGEVNGSGGEPQARPQVPFQEPTEPGTPVSERHGWREVDLVTGVVDRADEVVDVVADRDGKVVGVDVGRVDQVVVCRFVEVVDVEGSGGAAPCRT